MAFVSVLTLARFLVAHNPSDIQMPGRTECTKRVEDFRSGAIARRRVQWREISFYLCGPYQASILWIFLLIFVITVISLYDFSAGTNI